MITGIKICSIYAPWVITSPVILDHAVDEERHPSHNFDLFRYSALDRFVIIRD